MSYPHMSIRPMVRISFTGGFYQPGLMWVDPHSSMWEALQVAGGPQRKDGMEKIKWDDQYNVKLLDVDENLKKIVDIINKIVIQIPVFF